MHASAHTPFFTTPGPVPAYAGQSIPERMAIVMRANGGPDGSTDRKAFLRHPATCDLTEAELDANLGKAAAIVETPVDPLDAWDTEKLIARAVEVAKATIPNETAIFRSLREAGYSTPMIGAYWPTIMAQCGDAIRKAKLPQVA